MIPQWRICHPEKEEGMDSTVTKMHPPLLTMVSAIVVAIITIIVTTKIDILIVINNSSSSSSSSSKVGIIPTHKVTGIVTKIMVVPLSIIII
jgi:hypothetical protein